MLLAEFPLSGLFLFFLLLFVLLGFYPAWRRVAEEFRRRLKSQDALHSSEMIPFRKGPSASAPRPSRPEELNSYESMLLRRLSRNGQKGLSRKQLAGDLHLEPEHVRQALKSLSRRGLIRVAVTGLLGLRFSLSAKGQAYALEHDV